MRAFVVAHPDDDLFFMFPDVLDADRLVYLCDYRGRRGPFYLALRRIGLRLAYLAMLRIPEMVFLNYPHRQLDRHVGDARLRKKLFSLLNGATFVGALPSGDVTHPDHAASGKLVDACSPVKVTHYESSRSVEHPPNLRPRDEVLKRVASKVYMIFDYSLRGNVLACAPLRFRPLYEELMTRCVRL